VALLLVLARPLSVTLVSQLREGKQVPMANPVTWAVRDALQKHVAQDEGVEIMLLARPRGEHRVAIHIASQHELPPSYADELRKIVREQMHDPDLPVKVIAVRGLWHNDGDSTKSGDP
jgi:hypothetical protein